jgi:hypothetical protein
MNTVEKINEELKELTEIDAREVLDFVGYLKQKRMKQVKSFINVDELDRFGTLFKGNFNRDDSYDRKVLR